MQKLYTDTERSRPRLCCTKWYTDNVYIVMSDCSLPLTELGSRCV